MTFSLFGSRFILVFFFAVSSAYAGGLSAELENPDQPLVPGADSVFQVSLQNETTAPLFITGVSIKLSDNATGEVYASAFNQEGLNVLAPRQRWEGPLVTLRPRRRGPLAIVGGITVRGGPSSSSAGALTVLPLRLLATDPRRALDGSFLRGTTAACDRPSTECCEESEPQCIQRPGHCLYVAEGFDQEKVCVDGRADRAYEHVSDVQASSDMTHIVYRASAQCSTDGMEEHCQRTVVFDHVERHGPGVPGKLTLSPDGLHYVYREYRSCVARLGQDVCDGPKNFIVDGLPVQSRPSWAPRD